MHVGADPDCLGSAVALQEAFGGTIGAPDGLNKVAERLRSHLEVDVDVWPHPKNHDVVVAVDTGSRSGLGRMGARAGDCCVVDHHAYGDLHARAPALAWDPARASCAEVVLALLDHAKRAPSPRAARALLAGIVTDTARFRFADAHALAAAARLLPIAGLSMEAAYAMLEDETEEEATLDLRRACLLAAGRAEVETVGAHLVATTRVGSYDAAAAAALVRAGADVALVAQEKSDAARVSMRASLRARERGVHLGEMANEAAREIGWSGGGHEGAAGMRGKPPAAPAHEAMLRRVRAKLAEAR